MGATCPQNPHLGNQQRRRKTFQNIIFGILEIRNYEAIITGKLKMSDCFLTPPLRLRADIILYRSWRWDGLLGLELGAYRSLNQGLGNGSGRTVCGIPVCGRERENVFL